jgi:hypothetical protein
MESKRSVRCRKILQKAHYIYFGGLSFARTQLLDKNISELDLETKKKAQQLMS